MEDDGGGRVELYPDGWKGSVGKGFCLRRTIKHKKAKLTRRREALSKICPWTKIGEAHPHPETGKTDNDVILGGRITIRVGNTNFNLG